MAKTAAKRKTKTPTIRDRIVGLRRVRARDLKANPKNWRTHSDAQRKTLQGILSEIGWAGAALARKVKGGKFELIDGHLRKDLDPDAMVPVLEIDVTKAEADKLLATLDPIAAMAGTDDDAIAKLVADVQADDQYVKQLLADVARGTADVAVDDREDVLLDQAVQLRPQREYVVVMCAEGADGVGEFERLISALGLKQVRRGGYKQGSPFDASGTERVVHAADLLAKLDG